MIYRNIYIFNYIDSIFISSRSKYIIFYQYLYIVLSLIIDFKSNTIKSNII